MAFLMIAGLIAILVVGVLAKGVALSVLWGWFAVPLGLPDIGIAHAIGVSVIFSLLAHHASIKKEEGYDLSELIAKLLGYTIAWPMIAIGIGYIVKSFM